MLILGGTDRRTIVTVEGVSHGIRDTPYRQRRECCRIGRKLSDQGPFDTREQAEQRLNELEREKANGKFTIEELVLS